jgi:hypothetical protein
MKKIPTLFKKDPQNLRLVINEIDPQNDWVYTPAAIPTRKFDGTAAAVINGDLYKRYDVKKSKPTPPGAIPCQEPDAVTGHWPHWVKCDRNNPADKYYFDAVMPEEDGTYELCGEKVQGNPERIAGHVLIRHGNFILDIAEFSFDSIKEYLSNPENDIEGIVFHNIYDGRMCKIRKSDFGFKRND